MITCSSTITPNQDEEKTSDSNMMTTTEQSMCTRYFLFNNTQLKIQRFIL